MKKPEKIKPVTVRINEFRKNLNKVVGESGLPAFLLEVLLGEYLSGVSMAAKSEYEKDLVQWKQENAQDE